MQAYADNIIRTLPDAEIDDFRNKFQSLLTDLYTEENLAIEPCAVVVRLNANQAIAASVPEIIQWGDTVYETHSDFFEGSGTSTFTIPLDGIYSIMGNIQLGGAVITTGAKIVDVVLNNSDVIYRAESQAGVPNLAIAFHYPFDAGDEIHFLVSTPIALNVLGSTNNETIISFNREFETPA